MYDNYQYLYIAEEKGYLDFSKIGITTCLWERLRKLQQGNPRNLQFSYLFCGNIHDVAEIEINVKRSFYNNHEWIYMTPDKLRKLVISEYNKVVEWRHTNDRRPVRFREILDKKFVPYNTRTKLTCQVNKNSLIIDQLYENANVI